MTKAASAGIPAAIETDRTRASNTRRQKQRQMKLIHLSAIDRSHDVERKRARPKIFSAAISPDNFAFARNSYAFECHGTRHATSGTVAYVEYKVRRKEHAMRGR